MYNIYDRAECEKREIHLSGLRERPISSSRLQKTNDEGCDT